MNYVKSFDLFGTEAKQIPCITGVGAPTEATEGAIGCFYMNTDTGDIYKCVAVADGNYTWQGIGNGSGSTTTEVETSLNTGTPTSNQTIINGTVTSFEVGGGTTEIKLTDDDYQQGHYIGNYGFWETTQDTNIASTSHIPVAEGQTVELNGIYLKKGMAVSGYEQSANGGFSYKKIYEIGDSDETPITQLTIQSIDSGVVSIRCTVRMGTPLTITKSTAGSGEEVETPNVSLTDYIEVAEGSKIEITNAYLLKEYNVGGFTEKGQNATTKYATGTSDTEPITSVIIPSIEDGIKYIRIPFLTGTPPTVIQYTTVTTGGSTSSGGTGKDGTTFIPSVSPEGVISWTNNGGLTNPTPVNIKGADGNDGATFTPSVSEDGTLSWTNNGNLANPTSVNIKGDKGDPGTGISVKVSESQCTAIGDAYIDSDGNIMILTSVSDGKVFTNGGQVKGPKGDDGTSPTVTMSKTGNVTTISITDINGTKTEQIKDGANGEDGVSATHSWNGTTLTITSASGTSSADLKGPKGDDGTGVNVKASAGDCTAIGDAYIDSDGNIMILTALPNTFTNGGQVKGPKGDDGKGIASVKYMASDTNSDGRNQKYYDIYDTEGKVIGALVVTDGKDGNGISEIKDVSGVNLGYTALDIHMTDGGTQRVNIPNGIGIDYIGDPDVGTDYTSFEIVLTNEDSKWINVPNGRTPKITIEGDGNWYIDGDDTGYSAKGINIKEREEYCEYPGDAFIEYGEMHILLESGNYVDVQMKGDNGTTFRPTVTTDGYLTWTNDGYLTNPDKVNIKGPQGNGISSIKKTNTAGSVDTYTITLDNGDTAGTFTVTNGTGGGTGTSVNNVVLQKPYVYKDCKYLKITSECFPLYNKTDSVFSDKALKHRIPLWCKWHQENSFTLTIGSLEMNINRSTSNIKIKIDTTTLYSSSGDDISFCLNDNGKVVLLVFDSDTKVLAEFDLSEKLGDSYNTFKGYIVEHSNPNVVSQDVDLYCIFNTDGTSTPMEIIPEALEITDFEPYRFVTGKNIFNPNKVIANKTLDSSGNIIESSGNKISQIYKIKRGETMITISYKNSTTSQLKSMNVAFYDNYMKFISKTNGSQISLPINATYFIIDIGTNTSEQIMVEYGGAMSTFEQYYERAIANERTYIKNEHLEFVDNVKSVNKYNYKTRTDGKSLTTSGSVTSNSLRSVSDFIPCYGEKYFSVSINGGSGRYCFYNDTQAYLSYKDFDVTTAKRIAIPTDAHYIRVAFPIEYARTFVLSFTETNMPYERYGVTHISVKSDIDKNNCKSVISEILANKGQIKLLGDSITSGVGSSDYGPDEYNEIPGCEGACVNMGSYCWANLFKDYIEDKCYNAADGFIFNYGTEETTSYDILKRIEANEGYVTYSDSLLIVMIGTDNKWADATGSLEDLKNDLQWIVDWCVENDKKIILVSPPISPIDSEAGVRFYNDDIDLIYKEVAYKNNMDYISMYQLMLEYCDLKDITPDDICVEDRWNFNDEGHYIIYKLLMRALGLPYQMQ